LRKSKIPVAENVSFDHLADITDKFSGADIADFVKRVKNVCI